MCRYIKFSIIVEILSYIMPLTACTYIIGLYRPYILLCTHTHALLRYIILLNGKEILFCSAIHDIQKFCAWTDSKLTLLAGLHTGVGLLLVFIQRNIFNMQYALEILVQKLWEPCNIIRTNINIMTM